MGKSKDVKTAKAAKPSKAAAAAAPVLSKAVPVTSTEILAKAKKSSKVSILVKTFRYVLSRVEEQGCAPAASPGRVER